MYFTAAPSRFLLRQERAYGVGANLPSFTSSLPRPPPLSVRQIAGGHDWRPSVALFRSRKRHGGGERFWTGCSKAGLMADGSDGAGPVLLPYRVKRPPLLVPACSPRRRRQERGGGGGTSYWGRSDDRCPGALTSDSANLWGIGSGVRPATLLRSLISSGGHVCHV